MLTCFEALFTWCFSKSNLISFFLLEMYCVWSDHLLDGFRVKYIMISLFRNCMDPVCLNVF
jgi:hypothetical protein